MNNLWAHKVKDYSAPWCQNPVNPFLRVQGGTWEHASKVSKSQDYIKPVLKGELLRLPCLDDYPAHSGRISSSILLTVARELILCKQHSEIINQHFQGKIMIMTVTAYSTVLHHLWYHHQWSQRHDESKLFARVREALRKKSVTNVTLPMTPSPP